MSFFNNNQNETVRQTLERVMREKGMWQEPKVMHTEIGDFHYYDDNNTADNSGENNNAGLPSDYLQNNNTAGGYNQSGINGNNSDFGATNNFGTTSNFNTGTNFGATSPQNQTPTPWSYGSSSSTAPTSWNNNQSNNGVQSNTSSAWRRVKNFAQNAVNTIAPYTPTYYAGYSIGTAQNTFNKLKNLYNSYQQNDATYAAQQYGEPSVKRALKAYDWLYPLDISDVNKHQYVSCIGSTGGPLAMAETLAGGVYKEYDDYKKKMNNPQLFEQYGGKLGILNDMKKDLGNDIKGAWKGIWSNNPEECEELLPEQYRNKRYY